jgi:hypothetical protein
MMISRMNRDGNLECMVDNRRNTPSRDRRAHPSGGRRDENQKRPWHRRRRQWLAAMPLLYVGWRRVIGRAKNQAGSGAPHIAA